MTENTAKTILAGITVLVVVVGAQFFVSWVVMNLWNFLIPQLFHGPNVTYWQAFAFLILLWIIGSFFKSTTKE